MGKLLRNQSLNIGGLGDMEIKEVIDWMDWATIVFAFFAMFGTGINWWNAKKQKQQIDIFIKRGNQEEKIPSYIIRANFTRSEIFGVLGGLDSDRDFNIKYTKKPEFIKRILDIQQGKENSLTILLEDDDKFDWVNAK